MKRFFVLPVCAIFLILFAARLEAQYVEPVRTMEMGTNCNNEISVDGNGNDHGYSSVQTMLIAKRAGSANPNGLEEGDSFDFNAFFKAACDKDYLYLYVEVTDDIEESMPVGGIEAWTWDNIEVYIDLDTCSVKSEYDSTSTVQLRINRGETGITQSGRATADEYLYTQVNNDDGWIIEMGMPWKAVLAVGDSQTFVQRIRGRMFGFDLAVADADGTGEGIVGGRNDEGGAQMFWDQDVPIENADNAYQNRRLFGFAESGFCSAPPPLININDIPSDFHISIYPNPISNLLTIHMYNFSTIKEYTLEIMNILGKTLLETKINQQEYTIDLSNLTGKGIHLIRLIDSAHNVLEVRKLIIQ